MNCGLGIAERELLQLKLRQLPDTMPSRAVWRRIEDQARAEGLIASRGARRTFKWLGGAGVAAAVVLAVLNLQTAGTPPEATTANPREDFPTESVYEPRNHSVRLPELNALMVRSQQLEQHLRSLPSEPQLVRAGTAATISGVQDQIASIDYRLSRASLRPQRFNAVSMDGMHGASIQMTPEQLELYWRERVRLMNLLVELRTAQAQGRAF